ncbi:MAG: hypothetical protein WDO56_15775 [Gammaproteobacteria bacterium]
MDLFYRKDLNMRRSYQTSVWTFKDDGQAESVAEIFVRGSETLYYYRERFIGELPELSLLYYVTYMKGISSPRPYHQHLTRDASMFYCVLASFVACCKAWNLDPLALLNEADPNAQITADDLSAILEHARWERAALPGTWDSRAIRTLCDSLDALECSSLSPLLVKRTLDARGY